MVVGGLDVDGMDRLTVGMFLLARGRAGDDPVGLQRNDLV